MNIDFVFFLAWFTTSFLLTSYLKGKVGFFKEIGTPINFFVLFVIFLFLHKTISDFLNTREVIFLFLSIMSFGIPLSLVILKNNQNQKKRTEKEIIQIHKISSQSQVDYYNRKKSKNDH